ncbi:immunity 8 family protein [Enterobacteriaceae bacterium H11S18]|uniref:immunity 8 family protein n=1 Tax=Dryocola clanedunensis TaxID=2925396 RepID=UPI0022F0B8D0|nr:immunity 8 family protein [Dryocola clanedunensis]MCT4708745.1 immunity 8 family protein [Dryocola clanedunensis]
MKPLLKKLRSLEIEDSLINYWPGIPDDFGSWIRVSVGPDDQEGAEYFDMLICTPKWLQKELLKNSVILGRGTIIVDEYDYDKIVGFIEKEVAQCDADDWPGIAQKLSRIGFWEYEDYQPLLS